MNKINCRIGHHGLNVSMKKFKESGKVAQVDKILNLMVVAMMSIKAMMKKVLVSTYK